MAIVAHLVERTQSEGDNDIRDGISAVIVAVDDGVDTTDALVQARAVTQCVAAGLAIPTGYFDTNRAIAAVWDAAGDVTIFKSKTLSETIA